MGYDNNLRLLEIATGAESGTWGTKTNTNLALIAQSLGYNTQECFSSDADATTTIADGATDPARALYFKVTSSGNLGATRLLTFAPNDMSRVMIIENATSGSQSIEIGQGNDDEGGSEVTIANGKVAVVYFDGGGTDADVVDAFADLELSTTLTVGTDASIGDDLTLGSDAAVLNFGADSDVSLTHVADTGLLLNSTRQLQFNDSSQYINAPSAAILDINATDEIELNATAVDLNGTLDVSGTSTLTGNVTMSADATVGDDLGLVSDAAVLSFGADSEITLSHSHNDGLTLNTTKKLFFYDATQFIHASDAATLLASGGGSTMTLNSTGLTTNNQLIVSGTGPHAIGGSTTNYIRCAITGSYTSGGGTDYLQGFIVNGALTGASGDTCCIYGSQFSNTVVTQTATENIGVIAQAAFFEPTITDNLTGDITVATTVYIKSAPTEGEANYALWVDAGAVKFDSTLGVDGVSTFGDDISVGSTDKIYLDGGSDTYIVESAGNVMDFYTSSLAISIDGNQNIKFGATNKIYLDGGVNTYLYEQSDNRITFVCDGAEVLNLGTPTAKAVTIQSDGRLYLDGGADTYIELISNNIIGLTCGDTEAMRVTDGAGTMTGSWHVTGELTAGTKTFKIDHPLPDKADTHHLIHSCVESNRADLTYRGVATLSDGWVEVDLDEDVGLTEGTWAALCRDPQVWVQNDSGWDAVKGSVSGGTLTILCQSPNSNDEVSWLVVAERQDDHIRETDWTDDEGHPILEPEKVDG